MGRDKPLRRVYSAYTWSARVKVQVRVMCRMSVSERMLSGNRSKGAAKRTMRIAAWSSTLWPYDRLISTVSTSPSALIATVSCSEP